MGSVTCAGKAFRDLALIVPQASDAASSDHYFANPFPGWAEGCSAWSSTRADWVPPAAHEGFLNNPAGR